MCAHITSDGDCLSAGGHRGSASLHCVVVLLTSSSCVFMLVALARCAVVGLCVCAFVSVCACALVCSCVYVCMCMNMCVCAHVCMYVLMCMYGRVCVCSCVRVLMCVCVYVLVCVLCVLPPGVRCLKLVPPKDGLSLDVSSFSSPASKPFFPRTSPTTTTTRPTNSENEGQSEGEGEASNQHHPSPDLGLVWVAGRSGGWMHVMDAQVCLWPLLGRSPQSLVPDESASWSWMMWMDETAFLLFACGCVCVLFPCVV